MAHYARVISGLVVEVIVADKDFIDSYDTKPWEKWIKTSYNVRYGVYYDPETNLPHEDQTLIEEDEGRKRKNYAGVGYTYNEELDVFIPPTPFPSWIFVNETASWKAPKSYPVDGVRILSDNDLFYGLENKQYLWNEDKQEWTFTGWYFNEETNEWTKE